jgi:hypothetical protein
MGYPDKISGQMSWSAERKRNRPMKRSLPPSILCLVTLGLLGFAMFAAEAQTGKQIYSSRQPGAVRRPQPVYDDMPVYTDQPVVVEHGSPRMAPAMPFPTPPSFRPAQEIIIEEGSVLLQPESAPGLSTTRPLSGMDIPARPAPPKSDEPTPILSFGSRPLVEAATVFPKEQVDEFYVRLAKLQLEKKQLADVLTLIRKIKSDACKVKTLVEFAEYAAHEANYQKEADELLVLAQNGIDAFANGKPVSVEVSTVKPEQIEEKIPPKKPTLLDDEPVAEEKKPAEAPKRPVLNLDDDEPAIEEKKPAATPKRPILNLDDDEPTVEETKPTETPKKRPSILIDNDDDEPAAKAAPKKEPEQPAKTTTRRKISLNDE